MNEKKKHKIMLGIEVVLLCMIVAILGTNAASSNPPSNGVSYGKNNQTTVEGALNDLYTKANYGNASASQILSGKTALVGGKQVAGTMPNNLSGTASSVITYENSLYYRIPAGYYGGLGWGSEISATYADVASAIGLTAGKLLKGQTVLGITGTGETSCPECPTCPTCLNTSDATATAADISSGKTAYVNGSKITGSMSNKGAVNATVAPGGTYTIPAGYHNGSGKVTASSCPSCIVSATFIDSGDFSSNKTKTIHAEVGAYYLLYKGATTNAISSDSFSGCDILLIERTEGAKFTTSGGDIRIRSIVVLVKATSTTITITTSNSKGSGYKYAKISG
jgi:hypothetical protein